MTITYTRPEGDTVTLKSLRHPYFAAFVPSFVVAESQDGRMLVLDRQRVRVDGVPLNDFIRAGGTLNQINK